MNVKADETRAQCFRCRTVFTRVDALIELDGELLDACVGCIGKVLLGELPGRVIHQSESA